MSACTPTLPEGAVAPVVRDTFPTAGVSGYSATLRIDVEHGRGESVLPQGLAVSGSAAAWSDLKSAGFALPDQDAGAPARLGVPTPDPARPERAHTVLELPLLLLPDKPGRTRLELPPLPIAVARASGELMTACTVSHSIVVEDPIANVAEAAPQPNPPPVPQREDWMAARIAAIAIVLAIVLAIIAAMIAARLARRPKKAAPKVPARPPWELALARLTEIRGSGMLERGELREYVDAVSDTLRTYLGARYGFDGIESTTVEIRRALVPLSLGTVSVTAIIELLEAADLVKFARVVPAPGDCTQLMASADQIVRSTMPVLRPPTATPSGQGAAA